MNLRKGPLLRKGKSNCERERTMKDLLGSPGTVSGLLLRTGQCFFAAGSIGVMVSAIGFSNFTAYWYYLLFIYPSPPIRCFFPVISMLFISGWCIYMYYSWLLLSELTGKFFIKGD